MNPIAILSPNRLGNDARYCPQCGEKTNVRATARKGGNVFRYRKCTQCGFHYQTLSSEKIIFPPIKQPKTTKEKNF